MLDNAGQKLKGLAKFIFGFIVVISCLLAILGMKSAGGVTLLLIPAGIVVGWLSSILLHGYPFNTPQIIYNAVQINRPQNSENIV